MHLQNVGELCNDEIGFERKSRYYVMTNCKYEMIIKVGGLQ